MAPGPALKMETSTPTFVGAKLPNKIPFLEIHGVLFRIETDGEKNLKSLLWDV